MQFERSKRLMAVLLAALSVVSSAWAQNGGNGETEKPPERVIYLPFKNLKAVFEKPDGSVFVPYADYLKLWEKAFGEGMQKSDQPPVHGVISSANYTARIEKDVAQVSASLVVQVLDKGWAEIPVKFGEAAIGKINSDSGKVLLRGTGNGTYSLLIPTAGEHKIQLELTTRVHSGPDGKSLDLEVPPVGITNFEIVVPEADQTIDVKPKLVVQTVEAAANESHFKASVGSTEKLSVRWHSRVGTRPDMEVLASVTNQTLVIVEDGLIHTDTWLIYDVLRGQLDKVTLVVPKGDRILDITSDAKVKEWKAVEEGQRQLVTVEMLGRLDGKVTLEIHTERAAPSEAFDVAGQEGAVAYGIHAQDVIREGGTLAVKAGSDLTLTIEEQKGLMRVDETEIDGKLRRPGALYYKYYSPAFRLKLLAKPVEPRIIVDHHSQLVFREDQLRLRAILNQMIDRAGVFELKYKLPANVAVENVICDRMKQFDVSPDGSLLTVSLREKTQGTVVVQVLCLRSLDPAAEKTDQTLPLLEPQGVELENGKIQVYAPDAIDVITDAEKLVGAQPDPAPQAEPVPNARLVSSWVYNRRPVEIPVRTVRKATRLTAVVGTKADVKQGQIEVTTNLNYLVEYAGIDTFRFSVPESLADKVQITSTTGGSSPAIKQKSRAATAVDGWVTWIVVLQREVTGSQSFEIKYDLVPAAGTDTKSESATIEAVRVLDPYDKTEGPTGKREITVSRIIGEMTVTKDRALSVSAVATGGDVEPIDVRELQYLPQSGFTAFRYFKQPVKLELTSSKYDIQGVVETVVSKALVEIVVDRAGIATNRCRYVLKSSERQRLRIDLPANVELLGVLVDRKQTALEKADVQADKGWDAFYVSVARTKSSDEPFHLAVLFRHALNPVAFQNAGGTLSLRLPIVGGPTARAAESGAVAASVAVQQLQVKIWVPREYALVGTPDSFSVQTRTPLREMLFGSANSLFGTSNLDSWIGHDTGGIFEFPTEGGKPFQYMNLGGSKQIEVTWWHLPVYTWVISGAIVLIALILRNTSWENKFTVLIVALFAACAYALKDYDLVIHGLQASAYGLAALLAIWVISGVLRWSPHLPVTPRPTVVPEPAKPTEASMEPPVPPQTPPPSSEPPSST